MAALTGQPIPSTPVNLTVDIPNPMLAIAKHYAEVSGIDATVVVSQMVKEGLSHKIQSMSQEALGEMEDTEEVSALPSGLPEIKQFQEALGGLQSNMGNLDGIVETLNKLVESVNAISPSGDVPKDR